MERPVRHRVRTPEAAQFTAIVPPPSTPPFASPPRSHHSSPRTPQQLLSLHEYRKQQLTPSPPAVRVGGGRRIKRRPAAFDLNAVGRITSPPTTPPQTYQSSSLGDISQGQFPNPHYFNSLVQQNHHGTVVRYVTKSPSFTQRLRSATSSVQSLPIDPAPQISHHSGDRAREADVGHFRKINRSTDTIKRFPRNHITSGQASVTSLTGSENSSTSNFPSVTEELTSSSVFSLSKFPQPPQLAPQYREGNLSTIQSTRVASPVTSSVTPTTLHFRGASFDVVNPHQSLYLSNIETPADRDADLIDYFGEIESLPMLSDEAKMPPISDKQQNNSSGSLDNSARARALYSDLASAYHSIAVRPKIGTGDGSQSAENLHLATGSAPLDSTTHLQQDQETAMFHDEQKEVAPKHPLTPSGFLRRVSKVLNLAKRPHISSSVPRMVGPKHETDIQLEEWTNRQTAPYIRGSVSDNALFNPVTDIHKGDQAGVGRREGQKFGREEETEQGYYDVESIYPSSLGREDSHSLYAGSQDKRRSTPFGVRVRDTDYSSEVSLNPYIHNNPAPVESFDFLSDENAQGDYGAASSSFENRKDSTIGSILDRYQGGDLSQYSLSLLEEEEGNNLVQAPNAVDKGKQVVRDTEEPGRFPDPGLSQFDFGIQVENDPQPSFTAGHERMSPPIGLHIFTASAGAAPEFPLPLQPPVELMPPRVPFAPRNNSGASDIFSYGTSYGDTRNLLLLSRPKERVRTSLSPGPSFTSVPAKAEATSSSVSNPNAQRNLENSRTSSEFLAVPSRTFSPLQRGRSLYKSIDSELHCQNQVSGISSLNESVHQLSNDAVSERIDTPLSDTFPPEQLSQKSLSPCSTTKEVDVGGQKEVGHKAKVSSPKELEALSHIPQIWRGVSPLRTSTNNIRKSPIFLLESSDSEEEGDEQDWETVVGSSRAELESTGGGRSHSESYKSVPSRTFKRAHAQIQLLKQRYSDKMESLHEATEPVLPSSSEPKDSTDDVNGNPFIASSMATAPTGESKSQQKRRPFKWSRRSYIPVAVKSPKRGGSGANGNRSHKLSLTASVGGSARPEGRTGFYHEKKEALPANGMSGQNLVRTEHSGPSSEGSKMGRFRDASSDIAGQNGNSFTKMTVLGPNGNITGTPQGTGMREAGSSLANSSNTGMEWSNSQGKRLKSSPLVSNVSSPLAKYDSMTYGAPTQIGQATPPSQSPVEASNESPDQLTRHRQQPNQSGLVRTSMNSRQSGSRRASVRGQTRLMEMMLTSRDDLTTRTDSTRFTHFIEQANAGSTVSILPQHHRRQQHPQRVFDAAPRLERSFRVISYSPVLEKRQQQLSWLIFAACCLLPPVLLCYGVGWLDPAMELLSGGHILRCGRWQKKVALVTGTFICTVGSVVAIVVVLVFARP